MSGTQSSSDPKAPAAPSKPAAKPFSSPQLPKHTITSPVIAAAVTQSNVLSALHPQAQATHVQASNAAVISATNAEKTKENGPGTPSPPPSAATTTSTLTSTPGTNLTSLKNFRSIYAKEIRESYFQLAHRESVSFAEHFVAGGMGGMVMVLVGHPFDTVKVRLQSMPAPVKGQTPMYSGMMDCVKKTYKAEGFTGFFRGMGAPITGITPLNSIFFGLNAVCCELQQSYFRTPTLTLWQIFNAGAFSAAVMCLFTAPIERVKCLLQVQHSMGTSLYKGPMDVARKLYKQHGIAAVYRGFLITLARDIPSYGTKMAVYEYIKRQMADPAKNERPSPMATLMAGGIAGIFFWLVCIPQDTLKSYLQSAPEGHFPRGTRDVWRVLMKEEGPKGLFRGLSPLMARAFPANAACFLGVELTMLAFDTFTGPLKPVMDWPSFVVEDQEMTSLKGHKVQKNEKLPEKRKEI
ncbi:unnamed protein product [Bursaphelenchus xylophilus]|uniref:(pine wood nematode) hypothetical protein n=1 Tax=Bursaphelenchus xylophilus TaxID=6326 RepID=A0A1I7SF06_BURXY|nr:unnamed protein product [Bursaphelenchus xylophilus]CAG9088813.1 unnamed protein product [Bursaphelenchus xylophilus]